MRVHQLERRHDWKGRRATDHSLSGAAPPGAERPRVLVADDDPGFCSIQALYLRASGCMVFTAHDGHALEQASVLLPDVIMMNLRIGSLDGCEVARRLSESSSTRRIPVIAVAADPSSRASAFEAGFAAYLTKPCAPQICWAQIRALLRLPESRGAAS
jgi:CheY-like chemotaxis protein